MVRSASKYKTKSCGVVRHSAGKSKNNNKNGILPGHVIIEQKQSNSSKTNLL